MTARRPGERGFTTIEVLIAVLLLSTGVLASAQLLVVASSQGRLAKQGSDAAALAAHTIEQYRDMNYTAITGGTFTTTPTVGGDSYTVRAVVTTNDPLYPNMKRVRVTVTWNGGAQSYASETLLSNLQ